MFSPCLVVPCKRKQDAFSVPAQRAAQKKSLPLAFDKTSHQRINFPSAKFLSPRACEAANELLMSAEKFKQLSARAAFPLQNLLCKVAAAANSSRAPRQTGISFLVVGAHTQHRSCRERERRTQENLFFSLNSSLVESLRAS